MLQILNRDRLSQTFVAAGDRGLLTGGHVGVPHIQTSPLTEHGSPQHTPVGKIMHELGSVRLRPGGGGRGRVCHHGAYAELGPGEMMEWGTWDEVHKINLKWMGQTVIGCCCCCDCFVGGVLVVDASIRGL